MSFGCIQFLATFGTIIMVINKKRKTLSEIKRIKNSWPKGLIEIIFGGTKKKKKEGTLDKIRKITNIVTLAKLTLVLIKNISAWEL